MTDSVKIAYVPLTDSLPLLVAQQRGLFQAHGIDAELQPMPSWARLRDALLMGDVDAAHCLPGIVLASQAGRYPQMPSLATALCLNYFGNAITLHNNLIPPGITDGDHGWLRALVHRRREAGQPLTLASVFPVSKHEFELRHWLRGLDIDPQRDVRLCVVPPPEMAEAMQQGRIDGCCVGEPWNSLAAQMGVGRIVSNSQALGLPGTEKVLAVREEWLEQPVHLRLLACLKQAGDWLQQPNHREQALPWLAAALGLDIAALGPGLGLRLESTAAEPAQPGPVQFHGLACPDRWHARWLLGQMQMTGLLPPPENPQQICARAFRSDIYTLACSD